MYNVNMIHACVPSDVIYRHFVLRIIKINVTLDA
jgi:hypothetical protein